MGDRDSKLCDDVVDGLLFMATAESFDLTGKASRGLGDIGRPFRAIF
jgi:hypothetical protein